MSEVDQRAAWERDVWIDEQRYVRGNISSAWFAINKGMADRLPGECWEFLEHIADLEQQLAEARDKALRFDLDRAGIERREREAIELVELRKQLAEARKDTERAQWKHKSIVQLANDMQYKLDKNAHKDTGWANSQQGKPRGGWLPPECPLEFLVKKYHEEIGEFMELLIKACLDGDIDPMDLRYEAADVANLVMMMRDSVLVMIGAAIDRGGEG